MYDSEFDVTDNKAILFVALQPQVWLRSGLVYQAETTWLKLPISAVFCNYT